MIEIMKCGKKNYHILKNYHKNYHTFFPHSSVKIIHVVIVVINNVYVYGYNHGSLSLYTYPKIITTLPQLKLTLENGLKKCGKKITTVVKKLPHGVTP
jgi:hypothetical protein